MGYTIHKHHHHFTWDNAREPVHEIDPGEKLLFEVMDSSAGQLSYQSTEDDVRSVDFARVNPVNGPIYVKGAAPGDTLEVEILGFGPQSWGWTAVIPGFGLLADEYPDPYLKTWDLSGGRAQFADGIEVPIAPFPGTIGTAPPEPGSHSIVPPGKHGGNMDIRHLTRGTKLYLPVWNEGALFSVGDTHAAQGDGEVCGTAIEAPMDIELKFHLHKGKQIAEPQFETPGPLFHGQEDKGWFVTTGYGKDPVEAMKSAVRYMIDHLSTTYGLKPVEAYALTSVAVDLKLSEVVDMPHYLVTAYLPKSIMT
ncbi:acetamidase/formamidase family protein [Alkalicoccus urumqiensis]|uniref:Acetamidase n=1 Tax=Alkalicoccus urumqiensis TaxID=1548213 RepID=A0A2P6MK17_ALKUR|nr:acetamidase/formamidase family protein [Alkalicoccus urumqiensis]PRO66636.1 acetamidase [Alkalicoccus urumqiensis]